MMSSPYYDDAPYDMRPVASPQDILADLEEAEHEQHSFEFEVTLHASSALLQADTGRGVADHDGGGAGSDEEEWRENISLDDTTPRKRSKTPFVVAAAAALVLVASVGGALIATRAKSREPQPPSEAAVGAATAPSPAANGEGGDTYPTYSPSTPWPTYAPTAVTAIPTSSPTIPSDLFLFSGQSNVVGHTTSGASLTGDQDHWLRIKSTFEAGGGDMESELFAEIEEANSEKEDSSIVATTLSSELMKLYNAGLLDNLDEPSQYGRCSFLDPSGRYGLDIGSSVPVSWDAGCGESFGSEFTFGRSLEKDMGYGGKAFELAKVGTGGTRIYEDWSPEAGIYWNSLRSTIRNGKGTGNNWRAFVWHQGENDALSDKIGLDDTTGTYLGNLTALVSEVRQEMFDASEPDTWQCPEQIPTIITQIGYWPNKEGGQRVREAQAQFCEDDPRATLVTISDLSRSFHLDPASFLVIGRRVAIAYEEALRGKASCPGDDLKAALASELI